MLHHMEIFMGLKHIKKFTILLTTYDFAVSQPLRNAVHKRKWLEMVIGPLY